MLLEGRRQCDQLVKFLRNEFPNAFSKATVRSYGLPGIRQTRWIVGGYTLTADDVRTGREFPDTVVRCTWPIEIHDAADEATWEIFGDDHMHYVPLRSLVPPETEKLVAVGRCIDADVLPLSSVSVMVTCLVVTWGPLVVSSIYGWEWSNGAVAVGASLGMARAALGVFVIAFYVGYVADNAIGGFFTDLLGGLVMLMAALVPFGVFTFLFS